MRVLVIGPSPIRSKGGMATVINEIKEDTQLNREFEIDVFESFIDGGKIKRAIFSVWAYIKFSFTKKDYDIYHIHAASRGSTFRKGYYVRKAKDWGKKVILHIHGAQYMEFYQELSEKKKNDLISILETADKVIALSSDWKDKFERTFGIKNCEVLENGIDTLKLLEARTDPATHQSSFAMLGRLGKRKGTYDLIDAIELAMKKIPNIVVYLAGDGDVEKFRKLIKKKHLENNVIIFGWISGTKKVELLSRVSTVVLPSYNEGLPMSILEGMACGKVIISTTVGAIPEVIREENGILVAPGDVHALANALIQCSKDLKMMRKMSIANVQLVEQHYSINTMHKKLSNIYKSIGEETKG